ncbi:MAG: ABC transporter permease [Spirochaetaceae bacterium]|nr:ABC transporter permease [Spirochaetaceae bacterium]
MNYTTYLLRRLLYMVATLAVITVVIYIVIQLPPGDAVDTIVAQREAEGDVVSESEQAALRHQYGLDRPLPVQYADWMVKFLSGDMGRSIRGVPVNDLISERLGGTIMLSLISIMFTYLVAIPIGIYSATHQYSLTDYGLTTLGFIGLAMPNFLLGLILLYVFYKLFGLSIGGFFSPGMEVEPWSVAKLLDLMSHLWIPVIVIGTAATAGTIRVMRGTLLDELGKQYVITARAKGVAEPRVIFKYPVRLALNPMVSGVGGILPELISGETIVAIVLGLPTLGPLMYTAVRAQDINLSGSVLMVISALAVLGVLISDILLVVVDPRITYERKG